MRKISLIIFTLFLNTIIAQEKIITMEGKLKETASPLGKVITTVPKGKVITILNEVGDGYYFVQYGYSKGYMNEVYWNETSGNQTTQSNQSYNNSNYSNDNNYNSPTISNSQIFYTEEEYKTYFIDNIAKLDPIEGIWSLSYSSVFYGGTSGYKKEENYPNDRKVAIIKKNNVFELKNLESYAAANVTFESTASSAYLYKNITDNTKATAFLKSLGNILEFQKTVNGLSNEQKENASYNGASEYDIERFSSVAKTVYTYSLLKVFPTINDINNNIIANQKSSGTGFAISSGGLIATNYHVIENAKQIHIKGVNGNFSKSYIATIVAKDKNNDLAILKITDSEFSTLGVLPYIIKQTASDIGEAVNVLGYPLISTMGEDIKFTNGTISSKSGFQGDITSYQISAPIQPGNSGGPLFDKNGNIIGIVNAKHNNAENVGYAVKSIYLINLIETLPSQPKVQTVSSISAKSLPEQIKSIKKFVYIIEIN